MKNTELRLGNLFIEEHSGEIIKVESISEHSIGFSGDFKSTWQAKEITLTEEWLLKFGIYIDGRSIILKSGTIGVIQRNREGRFKYYLQGAFGMVHLVSIQYVHQL